MSCTSSINNLQENIDNIIEYMDENNYNHIEYDSFTDSLSIFTRQPVDFDRKTIRYFRKNNKIIDRKADRFHYSFTDFGYSCQYFYDCCDLKDGNTIIYEFLSRYYN